MHQNEKKKERKTPMKTKEGLSELTKEVLMDYAKEHSIRIEGDPDKEELISAILSAEENGELSSESPENDPADPADSSNSDESPAGSDLQDEKEEEDQGNEDRTSGFSAAPSEEETENQEEESIKESADEESNEAERETENEEDEGMKEDEKEKESREETSSASDVSAPDEKGEEQEAAEQPPASNAQGRRNRRRRTVRSLAQRSGRRSRTRRRTAERQEYRSYTVDAEDRYLPRERTEDKYTNEIHKSLHSNTMVLSGTVFAIDPPRDVDGRKMYFASVKYGDWKIQIPDTMFVKGIRDEIWNDPDEMKKIMENRLFSEVDFKIIQVDTEGEKVAMASRLAAMDIKKNKTWLTTVNGAGDRQEWRIQEGDIAQARIACVISRGMFVEVAGVESFIPLYELDYHVPSNANELFANDMHRVDVKIKSISRNLSTGEVGFTASVRETKPDTRLHDYSMIQVGSTVGGTVHRLVMHPEDASKRPAALVNLDAGYQCYAFIMDRTPREGDKVRVRINRKFDDTLRILGSIVHISSM